MLCYSNNVAHSNLALCSILHKLKFKLEESSKDVHFGSRPKNSVIILFRNSVQTVFHLFEVNQMQNTRSVSTVFYIKTSFFFVNDRLLILTTEKQTEENNFQGQ